MESASLEELTRALILSLEDNMLGTIGLKQPQLPWKYLEKGSHDI